MNKKKKEIPLKNIRLRFPPSPTGPLHVGNARTLLFNYLFAKKYGGAIVLRIEDTDKERSELRWVEEIIEQLTWLGIAWDEGPDIGGKFGPYKQSQRLATYKTYLEKLLQEKKAYYCFCSAEELEEKKQRQLATGLAPKYDGTCRNLADSIVEKNMQEGKQSTIRFKMAERKVAFEDLIRGSVEFDASLIGDTVIAKNLMEPLYNFAVVVDDFLMEISHVIRGEDHISNTPKQMLLQEALGLPQVTYAHLPLLLNPDKSKMSKRAGDVAVSEYRTKGYLPEALINFMALLGWNPGTEKEIFTLKELGKEFSMERVQKSGAIFNVQRLDFLNSLYIREESVSVLTKLCMPYLPENATKMSKKQLEQIVALHQARMKKLSDITELADFFFHEKLTVDPTILKWKEMENKDVTEALLLCLTAVRQATKATKWNQKELEKILITAAEEFNKTKGYPVQNRGYLLWPLRVALSGREASAGPFEIAEILGKEVTLQRIQDAIDLVKDRGIL